VNHNTDDMMNKYSTPIYNYYINNLPDLNFIYGPCNFMKNRNI
jgi:hypothetical protein